MSAETRTIPNDRPFEIWLWHSRHITPEQLDRWPEEAQSAIAGQYIQYTGLQRAQYREIDPRQVEKPAQTADEFDRVAFARAARAAQQAEARAALDEVTLPRWMAWLIGMAFFLLIAFGGARLLAWIASR